MFTVARNKAIDVLRRQKREDQLSKNLAPMLQSEYTLVPTVRDIVNVNTIDDDQLRMMFVCCHPLLSPESQIALILKTLCGFSITEIARAFVTHYDTIEKRLYRARKVFKEEQVTFSIPPVKELASRLDNVLLAVYLLFNEGYNSTQHEELIRKDLIQEALRLCELMCQSKVAGHSGAYALMALICFTASRNDARLDANKNILLLKEQDRKKWDRKLIETGIDYLKSSTTAEHLTKYHLEAWIAREHATAMVYDQTDWTAILAYYNLYSKLYPSPVVELNRAIVISELYGATEGIKTIRAIKQLPTLKKYYLLPAILGELYAQLGQYKQAKQYFTEANALTQSISEKKFLQQKIKRLPLQDE